MYDYDREHIRRKLRQRYNRRFFLGVHVVILITSLVLTLIVSTFSTLLMIVFITFVVHVLYALYFEYQNWLERKIDRELYTHNEATHTSQQKRKRYDDDPFTEQDSFRLTDDGELEPVVSEWRKTRKSKPIKHEQSFKSKERANKRDKKRRKRDTDEFDIKKLFKKAKDIFD